MCGITGILQLDRQPANRALLQQMLRTIVHRGPDDEGVLVDNEVAMGMRRLSIIDLKDGSQPISDPSRRFTVVFNGEIYNYVELREQLKAAGHKFQTQSDTEVIVHLFQRYGRKCVDHLRGMFAFAVWDRVDRTLFLARDRMGIKPLYFTQIGKQWVFASEIKTLLKHPEFSATIDLQALSQYLSLKFVPAPKTMFQGVTSLPPGHCVEIRDGQVQTSRYWDVTFNKSQDNASQKDLQAQLTELLRDSVRLRLRADVPYGAFLSGGVDSSLIVALMSEFMDEPVKTFSVGFHAADGEDELPHARRVAQQFGCDHHEVLVDGDDFLKHAERVLFHLDQPIADHATVATYMVAGLAREHVKMVLTGEGGDELFAGYARYSVERAARWTRPIPARVGSWLRSGVSQLPGLRRQKIALRALTMREESRRFANWFPMLGDDLKAELLADSMQVYREGASSLFSEHLEHCDAPEGLDRMLYVDSKMWLPDYLLLRGDKLSMAHSLEARVPLLDHELVEFAASLPTRMKLRGRTRKYLLKQCAAEFLPREIVHRPKRGFPIPIDRWLNEQARDLMHDALSPDTITRRGFFCPDAVSRLMQQHESGFVDNATELWGLISIEMWMQQFIDRPGEAVSAAPMSEGVACTE